MQRLANVLNEETGEDRAGVSELVLLRQPFIVDELLPLGKHFRIYWVQDIEL